jgi:O-antigen ligase
VGERVLARSFSREMWGYGMESFYDLHIVEPFNTNPAYPFESCDNAYVQAMVETGYVGLSLIGIILLVPAIRAARDWWKIPKPENAICAVLLINMLQYYFMMTNVAIYGWGQTGYMLWTWVALTWSYGELTSKKKVVDLKQKAQQIDELDLAWALSHRVDFQRNR